MLLNILAKDIEFSRTGQDFAYNKCRMNDRNHNTKETTMTTKNIIAEHTFVSPFYTSHAPNGSVSTVEQKLHHVKVFTADYYDKGLHIYVQGHFQIKIKGGYPGPRFAPYVHGDEDMAAKVLSQIKAGKEAE
jgi:hypothetical protein